MSIRKIILLFFVILSILVFPVAYAEANINKIDINTADALILENLRGIGPKKAAAIIEFRDKNGMFESVEDLKKINGIGQKTVDKNLDIMEVAMIPVEIVEDQDQQVEDSSEVEDHPQKLTTEELTEVTQDTEVKKTEIVEENN